MGDVEERGERWGEVFVFESKFDSFLIEVFVCYLFV